ncbi:MAG TPA: DNA-3-methyladenine glycosylase I [Candidatus Eremiobacteraceae bacterium]|nr:DNA-3-methyladenine glycosylase I [Candidatus Eremiobacteraceae bacterium]
MKPAWLVSIDVVRLRGVLQGATKACARRALISAARDASVYLDCAKVLPFGVRAIVRAQSVSDIRSFVHRFIAASARSGMPAVQWRPSFRTAALVPGSVASVLAFLRTVHEEHDDMPKATHQSRAKRAAGTARRAATSTMRLVERAVDGLLGADETAGRVRRYIAQHDAPADDAAAFGRLCAVVFSQGLSYEAVATRHDGFMRAFEGFNPDRVAGFDDARIASILQSTDVIRNEAKIRACVENARLWQRAAQGGSYLGRAASIAAQDDAVAGWPSLAATLAADFRRLGANAARQCLKRWGFFTACAHPATRRVLERLALVDAAAEAPVVQRILGGIARKIGRDPYAVEAVLALFAGLGPCRTKPRCTECALLHVCPTGANLKN